MNRVICSIECGLKFIPLIENPSESPVPVAGIGAAAGKTLERLFAGILCIEESRLQVQHIREIDQRRDGDIGIPIRIGEGKRVPKALLCLEQVESHLLRRTQPKRYIGLNEWVLCL